MWDLKTSNLQKQRVEWWLPGAGSGRNREIVTTDYKLSVRHNE
jgi:hypothetical protein